MLFITSNIRKTIGNVRNHLTKGKKNLIIMSNIRNHLPKRKKNWALL